jgi:hypothetical protein
MTDDEITAAGAAAVAGWPPLPERVIDQLAVILAPLADQTTTAEPATRPKRARRKAA